MTEFRRLGEREVHQGYIWRVVVAEFEAPDGERFDRDIVRSPGAVAVVPLIFDAEGNASVLARRAVPRRRTNGPCIEIPAGMRDVADEPPEETGRRELIEEAGLAAGRLDHLDRHPAVAGHDRLGARSSTSPPSARRSSATCTARRSSTVTLLAPAARRRAGDGRQR